MRLFRRISSRAVAVMAAAMMTLGVVPLSAGATTPSQLLPQTLNAPANTEVRGLSCPSAGNCVAVGFTATRGVVITETNNVWSSGVTLPANVSAQLYGVWCADIYDCWAVGNDGTSGAVYQESLGVWTEHTFVTTTSFTSISCVDYQDCVAVGNAPLQEVATLRILDGTLLPQTIVMGTGGDLYAVSCYSSGNCTAVGGSKNCRVDTWSGCDAASTYWIIDMKNNVWGTMRSRVVADQTFGATGVSCSDALNCTVVLQNALYQPVTDVERAGVWTQSEFPTPNGGWLPGVQCFTQARCIATGSDFLNNGHAFTMTSINGNWTLPNYGPDPGSSPEYSFALSCQNPNNCTTIGDDELGHPWVMQFATGVADAPTFAGVTPTTNAAVISWPLSSAAQSGGSPVGSYVASIVGNPALRCVAPSPKTSCVITGLAPGTRYVAQVVARNIMGSSAATLTTPFATITTTPKVLAPIVSSNLQSTSVLVAGVPAGTLVTVALGSLKATCTTGATAQCVASFKSTATGTVTATASWTVKGVHHAAASTTRIAHVAVPTSDVAKVAGHFNITFTSAVPNSTALLFDQHGALLTSGILDASGSGNLSVNFTNEGTYGVKIVDGSTTIGYSIVRVR